MEEVSRCQFTLAYDGPAVAEGTIPVVYLAPALGAIGTLFSAANKVLSPEQVRTDAYVRAFSAGSFEALLDIIQSVPAAMAAVFAAEAATTVANIKTLVFDTGLAKSVGLTGLVRELGGRKPVEMRPADTNGNVVVTTTRTTTVEIPSDVLPLYEDPSVRASLADLVRALDHPGIHELQIRGARGVECRIHADDREFFGRGAVAEQLLRDETRVSELQLVAPSFNSRQKWRFRDNGRRLNATIRDDRFLKAVAARQAQFAAGDTMVCRIRTRHVPVASGLRREHAIEQVLEHTSRDGRRSDL